MTSKGFASLPAATLPIDGSELAVIEQGGNSRKIDTADLVALGGGVSSTGGQMTGDLEMVLADIQFTDGGATNGILGHLGGYLLKFLDVLGSDWVQVGNGTGVVSLSALGSSIDISLQLAGKGAGTIDFYVAGALAGRVGPAGTTMASAQTLASREKGDARWNKITPAFNVQTGTSYTLALTDRGGNIIRDQAAPNTTTIPASGTTAFTAGDYIWITTINTGQASIIAAPGVTLNGTPGATLNILTQYEACRLLYLGTDEWAAQGVFERISSGSGAISLPAITASGSGTVTPP